MFILIKIKERPTSPSSWFIYGIVWSRSWMKSWNLLIGCWFWWDYVLDEIAAWLLRFCWWWPLLFRRFWCTCISMIVISPPDLRWCSRLLIGFSWSLWYATYSSWSFCLSWIWRICCRLPSPLFWSFRSIQLGSKLMCSYFVFIFFSRMLQQVQCFDFLLLFAGHTGCWSLLLTESLFCLSKLFGGLWA